MPLMAVFDSHNAEGRKGGCAGIGCSGPLVGRRIGRRRGEVDQGWGVHFKVLVADCDSVGRRSRMRKKGLSEATSRSNTGPLGQACSTDVRNEPSLCQRQDVHWHTPPTAVELGWKPRLHMRM